MASSNLFAQTDIIWKQKVVVNNIPVFTDKGEVSHAGGTAGRSSGLYGSEYARMLNLGAGKWLIGYTISRNNGYQKETHGGLELQISESTDNGRSWKNVSIISDPWRDLDNAQLIQLPDKSILLACRSVRWYESYRIYVYRSVDEAKSWEKLSLLDSNEGKPGELGSPDKGIYEPHFLLLDDGRLAIMYANETHVTENIPYSQIISEKISSDYGKTWGPEIWVAHDPAKSSSRPGMPVWTKMKNGKFIVVYEVCGPEGCGIYSKVSDDGYTWPVGLGTPVPEQLGGPYILSLQNGALVVSSNKSKVSVSDDYGLSWHLTNTAWDNTSWCSIYQTATNEVALVNSVARPRGGHDVQINFGEIVKK